jgi:hypothetical protein
MSSSASSNRSTSRVTIRVPSDRPIRSRWSPALVKFPLGGAADAVLQSPQTTRVVSFMGLDAAGQPTPQRGLVIATPAARFSGTTSLPLGTWSGDGTSALATSAVGAAVRADLATHASLSDESRERARTRSVESGERFVVARFDPVQRSLTLVDVGAPITVQPFQHDLVGSEASEAADAGADALTPLERKRLLTENFGSRKRLIKMERMSDSAVRLGTSMSGTAATSALLAARAGEFGAAEAASRVDAVTASFANLPPIDRATDVPADVFDLGGILTARINVLLDDAALAKFEKECLKAFKAREVARRLKGIFPEDQTSSDFFHNRNWFWLVGQHKGTFMAFQMADASQLADADAARERLSLLQALSYMIRFHHIVPNKGNPRMASELAEYSKLPLAVVEALASIYCELGQAPELNDTRQFWCRSPLLFDKLASHIIILMLKLTDYQVAQIDVTAMTQTPVAKAKTLLRFLSCFPTAEGAPVSQLDIDLVMKSERESLIEHKGKPGYFRATHSLVAPFKELKASVGRRT